MRYLISGYYGFGNLGDEALLRTIASELVRREPGAVVDALSATPETTAREYGIEATPRWDQAAVRAAIGRADVVLSGGGGLFQNGTSLKSLLYYAGIVRTATRAETPAMIFAQSIGPLDFWGKQTVKECCKGLAAATVRDEKSRSVLAPLVPVAVERSADPVFLYELPAEAPVADDPLAGLSEPLVIACVRKTAHTADGTAALAAACDRLAEKHGARVAFVSFGGVADAESATLIIRKCRSKPMLVPLDGLDAIARAISRATMVIGVRLHALILAIRFGVPVLAVPYDPKITGLLADCNYQLPPLWTPGTRSPRALVESLVDDAWARRAELAADVRAAAADQRDRAGRSFEIAASLRR